MAANTDCCTRLCCCSVLLHAPPIQLHASVLATSVLALMQEQSDQAPTDSNADAAAVDSKTAAATAESPLAAGLQAQGTPSAAENSGGTPAAATEEVSVFLVQAVFIVGMLFVFKLLLMAANPDHCTCLLCRLCICNCATYWTWCF